MESTKFTYSKSDSAVTVKTSAENTAKERNTATLKITAGSLSKEITVIQYGKPELSYDSDSQSTSIAAGGGTFTFRVWSDYAYEITHSDSYGKYDYQIDSADVTSGSTVSGKATSQAYSTHIITLPANEITTPRTITFGLKFTKLSGDEVTLDTTIELTQTAASATLDISGSALSDNQLLFDYDVLGDDSAKTITVSSNTTWSADINDNS